jgi:hypothetical protein
VWTSLVKLPSIRSHYNASRGSGIVTYNQPGGQTAKLIAHFRIFSANAQRELPLWYYRCSGGNDSLSPWLPTTRTNYCSAVRNFSLWLFYSTPGSHVYSWSVCHCAKKHGSALCTAGRPICGPLFPSLTRIYSSVLQTFFTHHTLTFNNGSWGTLQHFALRKGGIKQYGTQKCGSCM